ncbi:MAG: haloacid dehalogenase-like hydrolase [Chlamydiota bacterium]
MMNKQQTIALIFDFDDTLGPDSTSGFLNSCGIDVKEYWQKADDLYHQHWDPVLAYLYQMIRYSQKNNAAITKEKFAEWGRQVTLYPGVTQIFDDLRQRSTTLNPNINLEFYVISSGIEDIIRNSAIAHHFTDIWGCDFTYDDQGGILFPNRIVSYTDKTRYLFHIRKGLIGEEYRKHPFEVNRKYRPEDIRVPMDQMIFVGDGYTDIPCFSLLRKQGGIPLAVCDTADRDKWGKAWGFLEERRIIHWASTNYRQGTTLYTSLMMALETIAKRITIRNHSYQG